MSTPSAAAEGTQSAATGVENVLFDTSSGGVFALDVDKNALAAGDTLELRIYKMVRTGGTRRVAYYQSYSGVQPADDQIAISPPISTDLTDSGALRFSLKWTGSGGPKNFPWKVLKF